MRYSKKLGNLLFGKHELNTPDGLSIIENMSRPEGEKMKWPGNTGVLFMLYDRILELEKKINEAKKK